MRGGFDFAGRHSGAGSGQTEIQLLSFDLIGNAVDPMIFNVELLTALRRENGQ